MNDALSGALIGAVFGYLIARHSAEIGWIVHTLIG
jgi:F0F1-type ATP synthase assembly protein I